MIDTKGYVTMDNEWIYSDVEELQTNDTPYYGKYIHQVSPTEFSVLMSKKHIEQLYLIFALCVDQEKLENTNNAKWLYKELHNELIDIFFGGHEQRMYLERKYR